MALAGTRQPVPEMNSLISSQTDWVIGSLPFVLLLTAMAVLPLIPQVEMWWERNATKLLVSGILGLLTLAWIAWRTGTPTACVAASHAVHEYVPFLVLLFSLYMISGGVHVAGRVRASTTCNALVLFIGAVLANVLGTTGASVLLIRPLLRSNAHRQHRVHTVVFFIFLVSNVGGCLLPIGDPPLFLGFLRGVPFLWTLSLWKAWLLAVGLLLALYVAVDLWMQRHDRTTAVDEVPDPVKLHGWPSIVLLGVAVAVVGCIGPDRPIPGCTWTPPEFLREGLLLLLAGISVMASPWSERVRQGFSSTPIVEVAALFVGIFLTMQVPLAVLGAKGSMLGLQQPWQMFWWTGGLSSILDNAPTYLVFLEVARQATPQVAATGSVMLADGSYLSSDLLTGLSLGAVFLGAMTYIGNGPNLMVRSIACSEGVKMPGFVGYFLWAIALLLPALAIVQWALIS